MRRRRRLAGWAAAFAVVAAAIALLIVLLPSPADRDIAPRSDEPADVYGEAPTVPFTRARRLAVERVLDEFAATAVARRDLERAYDLATPSLRSGLSRREWASGDIPVYPFPSRDAEVLQVVGSHPRSVELDVSLVPRRGTEYRVSDFSVTLKAVGRGPKLRWRVDAFNPLRVVFKPAAAARNSDAPKAEAKAQAGRPEPKRAVGDSRLDTRWLLVPLAFLALIVFAPIALAIREWWATRRAERLADSSPRTLPALPDRGRDQTSSSRPS